MSSAARDPHPAVDPASGRSQPTQDPVPAAPRVWPEVSRAGAPQGRQGSREVVLAASAYGGILSRRELREYGHDRKAVARAIRAGRWVAHCQHTIAVHTGQLSAEAYWWRAIWECAWGCATLDGVSALLAAGLTGYDDPLVHVSVPRNVRCPQPEGVRIHRVSRVEHESLRAGVPRARPEVAALRAAHWAASDRQAALLLVLPVQQRLTTGPRLLRAALGVGGRSRRAFIAATLRDIADGSQSLGELDFAGICRRHGVPEPARQEVRRGPRGRIYLDARWPSAGLVVEIDGAGHRWGLSVTSDNLRANSLALAGDLVLRIDTIGLRLHEAEFMAQVKVALRTRGRR